MSASPPQVPNPDFREDIRAGAQRLPMLRAAGVEFVEVEPGRVVAEMPLTEGMEAPHGRFSAAAVGMLGDIAALSATATWRPAGAFGATIDFTVKMLAPAAGVRLRAEGRSLRSGARNATGAADIYVLDADGVATLCGTLLATARVYPPKAEIEPGVDERKDVVS